jgi:protein SCO1/2
MGVLGACLAVGLGLMGVLEIPGAHADAAADRRSPQARERGGEERAQGEAALPAVIRTIVDYSVPEIQLVRDDGREVTLRDELDDGRPVVVNFIYTSCTGICPLASHTFSELQRRLGAERDSVHLVSISIDPEEDTPARLREYAQRYSAGPSWQHYSSTASASLAAQRAFDVYRGDKMGHTPVTLLRRAPGAPWVRFDGFATADLLIKELHNRGAVPGESVYRTPATAAPCEALPTALSENGVMCESVK